METKRFPFIKCSFEQIFCIIIGIVKFYKYTNDKEKRIMERIGQKMIVLLLLIGILLPKGVEPIQTYGFVGCEQEDY